MENYKKGEIEEEDNAPQINRISGQRFNRQGPTKPLATTLVAISAHAEISPPPPRIKRIKID
jgi:hypothetical protein